MYIVSGLTALAMAMAMPGLCPIHDSYITNHIKVNVILNYDGDNSDGMSLKNGR